MSFSPSVDAAPRPLEKGTYVPRTLGNWPSITPGGHAALWTGTYPNTNGNTTHATPFEMYTTDDYVSSQGRARSGCSPNPYHTIAVAHVVHRQHRRDPDQPRGFVPRRRE